MRRIETRVDAPVRRGLSKLFLAVALSAGLSSPVAADSYRADKAGHPIRITAYLLHPFGVLLDTLIFRPAHWVGSQQPLKALFGHSD